MNKEKTKNIVMLKEIPSNIIEEAIIILSPVRLTFLSHESR